MVIFLYLSADVSLTPAYTGKGGSRDHIPWITAWLAGWLCGWLAGCVAGWLAGWLAGCATGWLAV